ncbi:MAG TPA: FAD/NAD(P)-binding protein, partial [Micrococcaceae bacterium]|nr:FAD/NAD(P)-binding protein [Micrococcaceae bacterium]
MGTSTARQVHHAGHGTGPATARPLRVAIIGAGPAGVYAADILTKAERDFEVSIDLFEAYPAPYG